jgi:hypothetical protein
MTTLGFGKRFDKAKAFFHVITDGRSRTKLDVGDGHDESELHAKIIDVGGSEGDNKMNAAPRLNIFLAFGFGLAFIVTILVLVVMIPNPTRSQSQVFAVVLSLAAGGFASVLSGMLDVRLNLAKKVAIGATGALAVFVIVYFFVPAMAR